MSADKMPTAPHDSQVEFSIGSVKNAEQQSEMPSAPRVHLTEEDVSLSTLAYFGRGHV